MPPDKEAIALADAILSEVNPVVAITTEETGEFSTTGFTTPEEAIMAIIRRHPMREEQVIATLKRERFQQSDIEDCLTRLYESGRIKKVRYRDSLFWVTVEERRGKGKGKPGNLLNEMR